MSKITPKSNKKAQQQLAKKSMKMIVIAFFAILVVIGVVLKMSLLKAFPVTGEKQKLSVTNGENYTRFIDQQAQDGKVSFPLVLKLYRKFFIHDTMKAGVYEVTQGMSYRQVLEMVSNAENAQMNRILVIEGTTAKDLIKALKKDSLVMHEVTDLPSREMLQALNIPFDHPEGLFAPNTYFFAKETSDKQILLDLYQRQMKILDEAWEKRDPAVPYKSKYEALIMASIIEKETSVDRELEQVSGVFARRLKLGMRLQTDPTVIYGMGDQYKGNITKQDLRTPTVYNTYTINGLPPTPIALPSKKAIEATMHPDNSDNIYFVATGNGGHKFTANLSDHNTAVQEYRAVMQAKN